MQRASCCCSGSRSGCCCWAICMLHAKCLSIEFVWLSVATSCGSTLTFFLLLIDLSCCCCFLCMVFFLSIIQAIAINIICDLRCLFMLLFALLFLSTICWLRGGMGLGAAGDIFMLRWARQTSWCVRCERRTPVSIYICTCIICVSFAAAVSICTTNCLNS